PDLTNDHLDDSLFSNLSMELIILRLSPLFYNFVVGLDVMNSEANYNLNFDDVLMKNKTFSSKNKHLELIETSSQCKHDLSVLEDLGEVKVKVQKLLLNQNTILNKLDKLLINDRSVDNCLQNITSTQELTQFNRINDILNNKAYYSLMTKKLSMYGGSSINDVTRHILIKRLSNEILRSITLTDHKGKNTYFASKNYFKVLLEVVQIFYESATENHVEPAIQSWFKRAPDHVSTNID
ncbi:Uncharacterized protein FWK35_00004946, partial [Aphis craccivora]